MCTLHTVLSSRNVSNNKPTFHFGLLLLTRHTIAIVSRKLSAYWHRIQLSEGLAMSPNRKACTVNGNHQRMRPLMSLP